MTPRHPAVALLPLLSLLALFATACGDDDSPPAQPPAAATRNASVTADANPDVNVPNSSDGG